MTFKEKLAMEHPEYIGSCYSYGCKGCPEHYGYETNFDCVDVSCAECWNRTIPETEERKEMKKSDLKTGYIVTTRGGVEHVVVFNIDTRYTNNKESEAGVIINAEKVCWNSLDNYNDNLTHKSYTADDIMKVERPYHPYNIQDMSYRKKDRILLWEREEVKEMTVAEIEELVGSKVKIVKES